MYLYLFYTLAKLSIKSNSDYNNDRGAMNCYLLLIWYKSSFQECLVMEHFAQISVIFAGQHEKCTEQDKYNYG